jgi:tetratricopeptide (TPR) repeat protein
MRNALSIVFTIITVTNLIGQSQVEEFLNYAIEFTESNRNEEAIRVCDKLADLLPDNPDIYFLRGVNKYLLSDFDGAISDFNSVIQMNPNYTDAYLFRAKSKKGNRNYLGALRDYNNARNENFYETISSLANDFMISLFRERPD